jgi:hypothetical protein
LPGRNARHCSPPTAAKDENVNNYALIACPPIRQTTLSSYGHEDNVQTLKTGILRAHCDHRLGAIASNRVDVGKIWLTAPIVDRATNRQASPKVSPLDPMQRSPGELAGAAALCCQGNASASPPRLAVVGNVSALLLKLCCCIARAFDRAVEQSNAIGSPTAFRFAFRVVFLASSEVRANLSRGVLLSGVAVLLCRHSGRRAGLHQNTAYFVLRLHPSAVRCRAVAVLSFAPMAKRCNARSRLKIGATRHSTSEQPPTMKE